MKKQLKSFFIELIIWVGITLIFFVSTFLIFLLIRLLFRKNGMEWEQGLISAYILASFNFPRIWDHIPFKELFFLIETMHVLLLSGTLLYFSIKFYKSTAFWLKFKQFYLKMPRKNQLLLLLFTITSAIPNKIWINSNRRFITLYLSELLWIYFCYLEPVLLIFFIDFVNIALFSGFFAYMYENNFKRSPFFQIQVKKYLFNGSDEFAKFYFDFFWGNMFSKFKPFLKSGYGLGITGLYLKEKITNEKLAVEQHQERIYNKDIIDYMHAQPGNLTPEIMKKLKEDALEQALYHQATPVLNSYNTLNQKFSEVLNKLSSNGF